MKPQGGKKLNRILAALLALAVAVLAAILLLRTGGASAMSRDNYIRGQGTAKRQPAPNSTSISLEMIRSNPQEGYAFQVDNMFPGDAVQKGFFINVSHTGTVKLYFNAALQDGTDPILASGLRISITRSSDLLYDGPFSGVSGPYVWTLTPSDEADHETIPYIIKVYLPTSAGNDFQNKTLVADLQWWVEDADQPTRNNLTPWVVTPSGKPDIPKTIQTIAQTGDTFPLVLLAVVCLAAFIGLIVLILRRRKDDRHERNP